MKEFVDKLIERLKKEPEPTISMGKDYTIYGKAIPKTRTIDIVNQLAEEHNNDFCEWEAEKDMFIQNPHTGRKFSNEPSMKNVYCNTCGKKIKIAPYQPKGE